MKKIAIILGIITFATGNLNGMIPAKNQREYNNELLFIEVGMLNVDEVKRLLKEGADVNFIAKYRTNGNTNLIWATVLLGMYQRIADKEYLTDKEMEQQGTSLREIENAKKKVEDAKKILDLLLQAGAKRRPREKVHRKNAYDIAMDYRLPKEILEKLKP